VTIDQDVGKDGGTVKRAAGATYIFNCIRNG
jgi:hypothetical protein